LMYKNKYQHQANNSNKTSSSADAYFGEIG